MEQKHRNCGLCGEKSCESFFEKVKNKNKSMEECPFNNLATQKTVDLKESINVETDSNGDKFDFILEAISGEPSARKIVRPFRTDLIEKLNIHKGCYIMGRPTGAGCPVTHVLKVYDIDELSGLLYTWAVGPKFSREFEAKNIGSYTMVGFEGIAKYINNYPSIGKKASFLPGFCMIRLSHHGLVNKLLNTSEGLVVRIEDIHIA